MAIMVFKVLNSVVELTLNRLRVVFFFSSIRRHTRWPRDWSSDVCSSDLGRSSWSLYNGLLAMGVNIGVDLVLIPRLGITGAAIGWAAAIGITNLLPLAQVAAAVRVHPFGRGMAAACALTLLSFAAIPLALRALAGPGPAVSITATALGCAVMALGMWLLHPALHLSAMPGLGRLARFAGQDRS